MARVFQPMVGALRLRPGRALAILFLALVTGVALYVPCRLYWAEALLQRAEQALAARDFVTAREHLTDYLSIHPNSFRGHFLMARTARRAGFFAEAERRLEVCERLEGATEGTTLERTLASVQQGDLSAEKALQARLGDGSSDDSLIREALCRGYRKNYLLQNMSRCLNAWLEAEPDNVYALLQRAWVRERQNDFPSAVEDYRRAVRAEPHDEEAKTGLASAVLQVGRPREAEQLFRRLHESQPDDPRVGLGLALSLRKLGRTKEARELLDRLAHDHPGQFSIVLEQGRLAQEMGNGKEAIALLREAVRLAPDDYQANYSLSMCLNVWGTPAEAREIRQRSERIEADIKKIADLTERLQQKPYDSDLRCEIGKLFLAIGEKKEGMFWLESALRANPAHQPSHRALADYYAENRQPTLAARHRRLAESRTQ